MTQWINQLILIICIFRCCFVHGRLHGNYSLPGKVLFDPGDMVICCVPFKPTSSMNSPRAGIIRRSHYDANGCKSHVVHFIDGKKPKNDHICESILQKC